MAGRLFFAPCLGAIAGVSLGNACCPQRGFYGPVLVQRGYASPGYAMLSPVLAAAPTAPTNEVMVTDSSAKHVVSLAALPWQGGDEE